MKCAVRASFIIGARWSQTTSIVAMRTCDSYERQAANCFLVALNLLIMIGCAASTNCRIHPRHRWRWSRSHLNAGVVFAYGLMLDVTSRSISDLRRELDFITSTPEITIPSSSPSIPLLGTPYFYECVEKDTLLPNTKLRDMDGTTVLQKPLDNIAEVVRFVDDLQSLKGFHRRVVKNMLRDSQNSIDPN